MHALVLYTCMYITMIVCSIIWWQSSLHNIQLHYTLMHTPPCTRYSPATSSVPTWLDNLGCTSTDTSLLSCSHNGVGNEDCSHTEDVAVTCSGSSQDGYGKNSMNTLKYTVTTSLNPLLYSTNPSVVQVQGILYTHTQAVYMCISVTLIFLSRRQSTYTYVCMSVCTNSRKCTQWSLTITCINRTVCKTITCIH